MWRKVDLSLVFLIVFAWMAGVTTYLSAAENLLQNPGFEEKDGWNVWGKETWIIDLNSTDEKHSGEQSFKIVIEEAKVWESTVAEQIIKDIQPGDKLDANVWVMVPEATPLVNTLVYLELFSIKEDGSDLEKLQSIKYNNQAVPQWKKLTISGTIPEGAVELKYWLVVAPQEGENAGTVYFDDARLEITSSKKIF